MPNERPVSFRKASTDRKLSPVRLERNTAKGRPWRPVAVGPRISSTYVSIEATCPESCTFKKKGCYVRAGFTGVLSKQLDINAEGLPGNTVSIIEADTIKRQFRRGVPQDGGRDGKRGRDIRLHVGGDVGGTTGAKALNEAIVDWKRRGGGSGFTYTHRWRSVPRDAWPDISVLASIEDPQEGFKALQRGYAPSLVVEEHPADGKAWEVTNKDGDSYTVIPCPAQTKPGVTCVQCRLCIDRDLVKMRAGISFAIHGRDAAEAKIPRKQTRLPVVG